MLRKLLGQSQCDSEDSPYLTFAQLRDMIDVTYPPVERQEIAKKVRNLLEDKSQWPGMTYTTPVSESTEFVAVEASLSLVCQGKIFLREYIFALIVIGVVGFWMAFKLYRCCANRRLKNLAKDFYGDVRAGLSMNANGLAESDILRKYLARPRGKDGLERTEAAFYNQVWPKLEQIRKGDRGRITCEDRLQFGRTVKVWRMLS